MSKRRKELVRLDLTAAIGHETPAPSSTWRLLITVAVVGLALGLIWWGLSHG